MDQSKFKHNTIGVFTIDHGWQMGEKNQLFKNTPWEESTRVPLIIRLPNNQMATEIEQPVSLVDLYPTFIDYCKLKGDNRINEKGGKLGGHSLRPLIENSEWTGPSGALTIIGNIGKNTTVKTQNFSYRTKKWRYILYGNGQEELYDHTTDSYEWRNIAYDKEYLNIKKELYQEVQQLINKFVDE